MAGRTTEVEQLNGEIIALGKQYHVPTPINNKLIELVREAERLGTSPCLSGLQVGGEYGRSGMVWMRDGH